MPRDVIIMSSIIDCKNKDLNWFFDLDETLYTGNCLQETIRNNILLFLQKTNDIDSFQALQLANQYNELYGSVLIGIAENMPDCLEQYLIDIHKVPMDVLPPKDLRLHNILSKIQGDLYIMTDSIATYANTVLHSLGVRNLFKSILDVKSMGYQYKRTKNAISIALAHINLPVEKCILVDNMEANILAAERCGMKTILISEESVTIQSNLKIKNIYELENILF